LWIARANGDTIVRGGKPSPLGGDDGLWYEPTLIEPTPNDSEIVQNEVFGPVLTFQTFTDEADAVRLANSTPYGLSPIVYTSSQERAERMGRAIRAGTVWTNCCLIRDLTAPLRRRWYQWHRPRLWRRRTRLLQRPQNVPTQSRHHQLGTWRFLRTHHVHTVTSRHSPLTHR